LHCYWPTNVALKEKGGWKNVLKGASEKEGGKREDKEIE
jgi:hypothetical protein